MSTSCCWEVSKTARDWIRGEIPGWVMSFNEMEWVLSVKTPAGERYVPLGWWITRHDDWTVTVTPEKPGA